MVSLFLAEVYISFSFFCRLQWIISFKAGQWCRPHPLRPPCPRRMAVGGGLWCSDRSSPSGSPTHSPKPLRSSSKTSRSSSTLPTARWHGSPPSCWRSCTPQVRQAKLEIMMQLLVRITSHCLAFFSGLWELRVTRRLTAEHHAVCKLRRTTL